MDFLQNHIEALIFCSESPVKSEDIKNCLTEMFDADIPIEDIQGALEALEKNIQAMSTLFKFTIQEEAINFLQSRPIKQALAFYSNKNLKNVYQQLP